MTEENAGKVHSTLPGDAGYQRSLEVHGLIETLYQRVEQHAAYFRDLMPVDSSLPQPPWKVAGVKLDPMVCALAIKAATTKRAVFALCELHDGANALALARVLLENACLLEWLVRDESKRRLESYVMFLSVVHERIVTTSARHKERLPAGSAIEEVTSSPYNQAVWTHTFKDAKGRPTKSGRPTWEFDRTTRTGEPRSVRELFAEITGIADSFEYDVLYGALGSDIVHSGPFSLLSIQRLLGSRQTFVLEPMPDQKMRMIALASSNTAMFLVIDSLTQYVGLDLSAELSTLKAAWKIDPEAEGTLPSGQGDS